jgi:hypothetical protein
MMERTLRRLAIEAGAAIMEVYAAGISRSRPRPMTAP